jgi:glycosyltransferase involved in cell wall biosynthesis
MNVLLTAEYYFANPPFVRISRELARRGHCVCVATSLRAVDRKPSNADVEIFEVKPLVTIYKIPHILSFPVSQISQIIREKNIDAIHVPNDHSTNVAVAVLIAKVLRRPFVYTLQGITTKIGNLLVDSIVGLYDLTVERWIAGMAQKVILLSESLIAPAVNGLKIDPQKIVVIPSGVDSQLFDPDLPEVREKASRLKDQFDLDNEIVIGYVGRLYKAKGLAYLFSALKEIQDKHSNIAILIVGDGAQRSELEKMARELRVRTIFAGWQRNVAPFYYLMDIFVLPSLFEGLPNVVLEAMAMKNAVIATNVGGIPDVLSHGKNGFLVPVRNIPELALALEKLIADENLRARMGTINRQKIEEHFSWKKTADKVEKVYSECIGS